MLRHLLPEELDVLAARGLGEDDRRAPGTRAVEGENRAHLVQHRLRRGVIHLVDRDHVGDLHDARLQRLHAVARPGHQHEHDGVGDPHHLDLALAGADGLDENELLPRGVEHEQRLQRRLREAAEMAASAHRPDEHLGIGEVVGEPDAIAEQGAVRERRRRIDGDDSDGSLLAAHVAHEPGDQRRLSDSRWPRDPDCIRVSRLRIEVTHDVVGEGVTVLDERDRTRQRAFVARAHTFRERLPRPVAAI